MNIEIELQHLFKIKNELHDLLVNEEYELFQKQQELFSEEIKALLDNNSAESLATAIEQLKELEKAVGELHNESEAYFLKLKQQSLQQKRNKKKIGAYK